MASGLGALRLGPPTADRARLVAVVRGGINQSGYVSVGSADGASWTAFTSIGGVLASGPAVTSWQPLP